MRTAVAVLAGLMTLCGCASSAEPPAGTQAEAEGFPSLRDVPRTTTANTNAAYWANVERNLVRAREEMQANPRAEPAPPAGSDEFVEQARQELEESRQAHPDE
jgi:hypothetical protein